MAKKAELLEKAAELKLEVSEKNTIAEIEAAIAEATDANKSHDNKDKDVVAEREAVVAKSGKRSQKALDEAAEKAEKEARKEAHKIKHLPQSLKIWYNFNIINQCWEDDLLK